MKRSSIVRWICALAVLLCFWGWNNYYLSVTHAKAWEWNSFSLIDIVDSMSIGRTIQMELAFRNAFRNMGITAIVCALSPLVSGIFGLIRPASRRLLPISVVSTLLLIVATATLYFEVSSLYGMAASSSVIANSGTYTAGIVAAIEIGAGIIAHRTSVPPVAESKY